MTRDDFLNCCAERIQALINAKVASPSKDEIIGELAGIYVWAATKWAHTGGPRLKAEFRAVEIRAPSFENSVIERMAAKGFAYEGWRCTSFDADALVMQFCRDGAQRATVTFSGLEQLQNSTPEQAQALIEARCEAAAGFGF